MVKNNSSKWWLNFWTDILLIFLLIIGIGIYQIVREWDDVKNSYFPINHEYKTTIGTIVSSDVITVDCGRHTRCEQYLIFYNYTVGGFTFSSEKVSFAGPTGGPYNGDYAISYWRKYQPGDEVEVFYDINNPAFAVLEPNVKRNISFPLLLIGIGLGGSIWVFSKVVRIFKLYYADKYS